MADQAMGGVWNEFTPPNAPVLLRRFADFWAAARGDRMVPNFADLDPVEMPWALPTIFVIERRADRSLTYRLVGEVMRDRLGGRLIGKTAKEVFEAAYARQVNARWNRVLDEPALCYVMSGHLTQTGRKLSARRFLAPARSTTGEIDRIVGVSAFDQAHVDAGFGTDGGTEIDVRWSSLKDAPGAAV